jgi:hypothetical protein
MAATAEGAATAAAGRPVPKIRFGIVGGGWWAEMYLRIAASLPEQLEVSGMVVRREEAGRKLEQQWGVRTFRTLEAMTTALGGGSSDDGYNESLLFVVIAVPQPANAAVLQAVVRSGVPALGQTPAGWTLEECTQLHEMVTLGGKRVQIAEQYHMQPIHQARLALMNSGRLGEVSQAQVSVATACECQLAAKTLATTYGVTYNMSCCMCVCVCVCVSPQASPCDVLLTAAVVACTHTDHGTSLARMFLNVGAEQCTVRAITHESPLMDGIGRYSSASGAQTVDKRQGGLRNAVHGPKDGGQAVVAAEESVPSSRRRCVLLGGRF